MSDFVNIHWTDSDIFSLLMDDDEFSSGSSSDSSLFEDASYLHSNRSPSPEIPLQSNVVEIKREPHVVVSRYRDSCANLSDEEFFEEFRINRELVDALANQFERSPQYNLTLANGNQMAAYDNLVVFLWFAGHKTDFVNVCNQFGISHSSTYRNIRHITGFLASMADSVITWMNKDEMKASTEYFRLKGLPFTVGAIGVEQITSDKNAEEGDSNGEMNRFTIPVIADHKKCIRHIYIGSHGSEEVESVFESSKLHETLEQLCGHSVILGDNKYPCLRNLLTPYQGTISSKQKLFNQLLSRGRGPIEACFKKLKMKFPQLEQCKFRFKGDVKLFVTACCVLHNLSLDDDFLQQAGRTLRSILDTEALPQKRIDTRSSAGGLEYREEFLTAVSMRMKWK